MGVPFGFGVGDFLAISRIIYKIGLELKKNAKSAPDYQLLMVELQTLDRTLKLLQGIKPAQHEMRRLDTIRALASTCRIPLEEFLAKIEKFEDHLGSRNVSRHSFSGVAWGLRWSMKCEDDVKALRAKLAPNVATITVLLLTQTIESLSNAELGHVQVVQGLKQATSSFIIAQARLEAGQSHLISSIAAQDHDLSTLKSKADDLLRANTKHDLHLCNQAAVLKEIQENGVALDSRIQETEVLATSIRQDTAEIKAAIPSILGRALELMNAVTAAVRKIQDITALISQMIRLTAEFTVEMREIMTRLLHAFWDIQKQLSRLERFLPKQIDLPVIRFRDAFNEMRSLPYDLSRQWQTFQGLVAVIFMNRQGLHRVNMGQYFVTNVRIGRKINPTFWSHAIEPGDELSMTMILDDFEAVDGFCPYKSCGVLTKDIPLMQGGKICPNCCRFAAMSQTQKIASVKNHQGHRMNDTYHEATHLESSLEPLSDDFVDFTELDAVASSSQAPQAEINEAEDVELYYSIQVVQAVLDCTYEDEGQPEPEGFHSSNGKFYSVESIATTTSSMQIFVRNMPGETMTLRVRLSDSIATVKDMIYDRMAIPQHRQNLIFAGKQLENNRTLFDYGIQKENTLDLRLRIGEMYGRVLHSDDEYEQITGAVIGDEIKVYGKTLTGKTLEISIKNNETIEELRNKIEVREGAHQTLIYNGVQLEDSWKIYEYNIAEGTIIHLVKRFRPYDPAPHRAKYRQNNPWNEPFSDSDWDYYTQIATEPGRHSTVRYRKTISLVVKPLGGTGVRLAVKPSNTIEKIKRKIHKATGVPITNQKLMWSRKTLRNEKTISDYSISNGDVLVMLKTPMANDEHDPPMPVTEAIGLSEDIKTSIRDKPRPSLQRSPTSARTKTEVSIANTAVSLDTHTNAPSIFSSFVSPRPPPAEKKISCLTCGDDSVPTSRSAKLSCTHRMCHSCLKRIFTRSVTDPAYMPPRCCTSDHIPLKHVEKLFDQAFKKKWNRKFQEYTTRNRIYCSSQGCGAWIKPNHIEMDKSGRKVGKCQRCGTKVCCLCNKKAHGSSECPKDPATREFIEIAKQKGWQQCYSCKAMVKLKEGCNHMTCSCTAEFCMVCGVRWKGCDCPWFNYENFDATVDPLRAQEALDRRREQEQRDEVLARRMEILGINGEGPGEDDMFGIGNAAGHHMNAKFIQQAREALTANYQVAEQAARGLLNGVMTGRENRLPGPPLPPAQTPHLLRQPSRRADPAEPPPAAARPRRTATQRRQSAAPDPNAPFDRRGQTATERAQDRRIQDWVNEIGAA